MSTDDEAIELAWAAGLFDGEGSTVRAGRRRQDGHYPSIRMCLSQKDTGPELLLRFQSAVKEGTVRERADRPEVWVWSLTGEPCKKVLKALWPYLSSPKKRQAKATLKAQKLARATSPQRKGRNW